MIRRVLVVLLLLCFAAIYGLYAYNQELHRPLTDEEITFEIMRGDSLKGVAKRLVKNKVLRNPYWFTFTALVQGVSNRLKAGEYVARSGITLNELLALLVRGAVQQHALLLVEGWNYRQVLRAVCDHPAIVRTICDRPDRDFAMVFDTPETHPEGRFFPDTYYLTKGTTDIAFLKRAARRMDYVLRAEWLGRSQDLPFKSSYEALILASIIEKETARAGEREEISGVLIRRLEKGMLLQTDPTVIYGIGERFDGDIRSADLLDNTPYNTYVRPGLPPTPIAIPGIASIHAALHPRPGNFLYFVARGDGSHYFSATLNEHLRAVNEYQLRKFN
ncbi:MAG: endolytic transglycosylase MltG [Gammaproteobacteria bacterium]